MSRNKKKLVLRPKALTDQEWIKGVLTEYWADIKIVTRGILRDASALPAVVAQAEGVRCGLAIYSIEERNCELVSLNSLEESKGIGSSLLAEVERIAMVNGCIRVWLITTNDNTRAIEFYKNRGYNIVSVHKDAITKSRQLKPSIPRLSSTGIPITDEIELEKLLIE